MGSVFWLILIFLAGIAYSTWINPVQLATIRNYDTKVQSVYRDPTSHVNHGIINNCDTGYYVHYAVSDSGQVLHTNIFPGAGTNTTAIIRGTGNGKYLYLVIQSRYNGHLTAKFTRSKDGGKTWSTLVAIPDHGVDKLLQDMLYVARSERLFIFFVTSKNEIKFVTKHLSSDIFSQEFLIAEGCMYASLIAKATATSDKLIHLFYKPIDNRITHAWSDNNGVSWTKKETSVGGSCISNAVSDKNEPKNIYLITAFPNGQTTLYYTKGEDKYNWRYFGTTYHLKQGLATCSNKDFTAVYSYTPWGHHTALYCFWETEGMKQVTKDHPFQKIDSTSAGIDCSIDGLVTVSLFVFTYRAERITLWFTREHTSGLTSYQKHGSNYLRDCLIQAV
eukprot:TRINITY_DN89862_c0_g1_i1.p1 TRINITY_DN89862_c0_g1~~TRINITY_DN89862_c0_g1_i1.p1  ORF type:complete len:436 (+),score=-14.68 TRINITY_DN89862_c0_g1_i1:139-1308(+)